MPIIFYPVCCRIFYSEPDIEKRMQGLSTSINCVANLPAAEALEKHCKFIMEKVNDQS